jgi:hypothetical protein
MSNQAIVVFTYKSVDHLIQDGGTSSWRLDRNHALHCTYAVCTRNGKNEDVEGTEAHGSAFLVGKVSGIVEAPEHPDRYLIQFSEYALVDFPDVWKGDRNPVKYATLEDLGFDPSTLEWKPMRNSATASDSVRRLAQANSVLPLTMVEAKKGLALAFGVSPDAIEITIRG